MSTVVVVKCDSYEREKVYKAMKAGMDALGGIRELIPEDSKILVKLNLLQGAEPEKAITTHPAVAEAMLRLLHEEGYTSVTYGDSPGHGSNASICDRLGISKAAENYGAVRADMDSIDKTVELSSENQLYLAKGVTDADVIINLCKMKTHALERITGAVKNVYGFVCGPRKLEGHVKYPNASVFAGLLADLHKATDIRLHIMDGILAMEGNGPASGDPVSMNVLLFSTDPVALDAVYCSMIDLDPGLVPTCTQGQLKGIGTWQMKDINIYEVSEGFDNVISINEETLRKKYGKSDFNVNRASENNTAFARALGILDLFSRRPVIDKKLCVHCGICREHCPVPGKALSFAKGRDKPPVYNYRKCIRCYCCQEMCPQKAISVR